MRVEDQRADGLDGAHSVVGQAQRFEVMHELQTTHSGNGVEGRIDMLQLTARG
jgi:hypothetical protein